MNKKIMMKIIWIAIGQFIAAIGFNCILLGNNLIATGFGGLSTVIHNLSGINIQLMLLLLAGPVFLWAFFNNEKKQILFAAFSYFMFTFYVGIVEKVFPIFKTDPIIAAVSGGVIMGIASGIIMRQQVANGPEAIVGMYLKEKKGISIGSFFLILNTVIICSSIVYGDLTLIIYSLISNFVQSMITDNVIIGTKRYYIVNIMSDNYLEITEYIRTELHRGVTFIKGLDTADVKKKMLIQTVASRQELIELKEHIKAYEDDSFVYATQSSTLLGQGFDFNS